MAGSHGFEKIVSCILKFRESLCLFFQVCQDRIVHQSVSAWSRRWARLERTALSVSVRERLDFSCALLDKSGRLVAIAAPHTGPSWGHGTVRAKMLRSRFHGRGDLMISNHPGYGGSHLPGVTVMLPVFGDSGIRLLTLPTELITRRSEELYPAQCRWSDESFRRGCGDFALLPVPGRKFSVCGN